MDELTALRRVAGCARQLRRAMTGFGGFNPAAEVLDMALDALPEEDAMGDGPDWRQVDRARLLAARAEERKKITEEWIAWCEDRSKQALSRVDKDTHPSAAMIMQLLSEWLLVKANELRERLSNPDPNALVNPPPKA